MNQPILQSKMARRLVRLFVVMVGVPLTVTALVLGYLGRLQIIRTAKTMEHINTSAVQQAGKEFQKIGGEAVAQVSRDAETTSIHALESVSKTTASIQTASLSRTARDLTELTRDSFDGAIRKSQETHRHTLDDVRGDMTGLFERSARDTQNRAGGRIESAMRAQIDTLMQERAQHLAQEVQQSIAHALDYLTITAQAPDLRDGNVNGQKAILDSLVRRFPSLILITVQDKTGRETAMSAAERVVTASDLGSYPNAAYFREAMQGKEYIGQDELPTTNGAPTLRLAVPIEMYRGKPIGVLSAHYSLENLWNVIRNTRIGKEGFAYVLGKGERPLLAPRPTKGTVLTSHSEIDPLNWRILVSVPRDEAMQPIRALNSDISSNTRIALGKMRQHINHAATSASARLQEDARNLRNTTAHQIQAHADSVLKRIRASTSKRTQKELGQLQETIQKQAEHTQRSNTVRMSFAANTALNQTTHRVQPLMQQALQTADRRLMVLAFLLTIVSCTLSCVIALFTAGKIVRPVVDLAQVTQAIAQGDLDKRVNEGAPDEIGDLAVAFNTMADSLKQSHDELNTAEAQLVQSAKLASLGTLSAGVAHELNQPIAIIRGLTQQLKGEPEISEDIRADLELIEGQTSRMIKIVQHLRTFSRAGVNEYSAVDVNHVLQDCFILIGEQLRAHNVAVELSLCKDAPPVLADANELEQVFLNLITNARDALENTVEATIFITTSVSADRFILEFRDNGTGIPEEVLSRIFDPFFTTKEPGKGTGLGLSISHTIISRHKGEIRAENRGGAAFIISLPLASLKEDPLPLAA